MTLSPKTFILSVYLHQCQALDSILMHACSFNITTQPLPFSAADMKALCCAGERIHAFMMSFTDGRDAGLLLVSHFSLLTGMAVPIWLSSVTTTSACPRHEASDLSHLDLQTFGRSTVANPRTEAGTPLPLTAFAGIMILGIADSAASAIGKKYGRHRICIGTKKTVEGTLGAALLTLLGWALVAMVFQSHLSNSASATWDGMAGAKLLTSTLLSCLLEASTTQLDNIFMPLHYFAMLSL